MLKSFLQAHFFFELRIAFLRAVCYNNKMYGEMSERFKELVLKTSDPARGRGFESHSLRQVGFIRTHGKSQNKEALPATEGLFCCANMA